MSLNCIAARVFQLIGFSGGSLLNKMAITDNIMLDIQQNIIIRISHNVSIPQPHPLVLVDISIQNQDMGWILLKCQMLDITSCMFNPLTVGALCTGLCHRVNLC